MDAIVIKLHFGIESFNHGWSSLSISYLFLHRTLPEDENDEYVYKEAVL